VLFQAQFSQQGSQCGSTQGKVSDGIFPNGLKNRLNGAQSVGGQIKGRFRDSGSLFRWGSMQFFSLIQSLNPFVAHVFQRFACRLLQPTIIRFGIGRLLKAITWAWA
jgi:hypothetical protein